MVVIFLRICEDIFAPGIFFPLSVHAMATYFAIFSLAILTITLGPATSLLLWQNLIKILSVYWNIKLNAHHGGVGDYIHESCECEW